MAKNKQNKPKKESSKMNAELTSMAENSNNSKKSRNGYMDNGGNQKENQLK